MRAVIYCRVSTVEQSQNLSLSTQEEACRDYFDRLGYDADAVIVHSLTRFSRNSTDHHAIAAALRGLGIAMRSVTEPIDDTPSGRLMEGILASMAQFDNDVRSERAPAVGHGPVDRARWV
jgi:site-specific DNA recombinase